VNVIVLLAVQKAGFRSLLSDQVLYLLQIGLIQDERLFQCDHTVIQALQGLLLTLEVFSHLVQVHVDLLLPGLLLGRFLTLF
jgi:hypothetical protein